MAALAVTVAEAAELLGVSVPFMYQLVRRADFPSKKIGNRVLISRKGLEEWIYNITSPEGGVSDAYSV